jgi:hypothetical protein
VPEFTPKKCIVSHYPNRPVTEGLVAETDQGSIVRWVDGTIGYAALLPPGVPIAYTASEIPYSKDGINRHHYDLARDHALEVRTISPRDEITKRIRQRDHAGAPMPWGELPPGSVEHELFDPGLSKYPLRLNGESQVIPMIPWKEYLQRHCRGDHGVNGIYGEPYVSDEVRFAAPFLPTHEQNAINVATNSGLVVTR